MRAARGSGQQVHRGRHRRGRRDASRQETSSRPLLPTHHPHPLIHGSHPTRPTHRLRQVTLGALVQAGEPHGARDGAAHQELQRGERERVGEDAQHLLVVAAVSEWQDMGSGEDGGGGEGMWGRTERN